MRVCGFPNYFGFRLRSLSEILKTRNYSTAKNGSASVLKCWEKALTLLGPLERVNLNHWVTNVL
jgi:hypothetical protein